MPGVVFAALDVHGDDRGSFAEIFRADAFPATFVQSNHSKSRAGVLRGLHYHRRQADLWYVTAGRAQVALADLRGGAGRPATATLELAAETPSTLYIPAGVAHGFLALTDVDLLYWVTAYFDNSDEHGVTWDDPTLAIPWASSTPVLSERDRSNPELAWDQIAPFT
ncbi:MAG TPA: dTDP-4-dehydrorhamnose 3,5-epimerase family protein [Actinomycetota bacterium]